MMDTSTKIALVGVVVTTVGVGVAAGGLVQTSRIAARNNNNNNNNNNSRSAESRPTSMTPQQTSDFERRQHPASPEQRNTEQGESQERLDYEGARANRLKNARAKARVSGPAGSPPSSNSSSSSSSSSPALPRTPPQSVRLAQNEKKKSKPIIRGAAPKEESVLYRPSPVAAASGSDARAGAATRQKSAPANSSTSSKSTRRGTEPRPDESFLDMS